MTRTRRLFILEPSMNNRVGHAYWFAKWIADAGAKRGWEPHVLGHASLAEEHLFPAARRWFSVTQWDQVSQDPLVAGFEDFHLVAHRLADDLRRLTPEVDPETDFVFVGTPNPTMIHALALWLAEVPGVPCSLNTGLPTGVAPNGAVDATGLLYRVAYNRLPSGHRVRPISTTEAEARAVRVLSGLPTHVGGWPMMARPPVDPPPLRDDEVFTVFCPGSGHRSQRFDLLGEMMGRLKGAGSGPMRLVMQSGVTETQTGRDGALEWVQVPRGLEQGVYERFYRLSDAVLLPYEPEAFRTTVSGQFCFAACFGLPMIVPNGTSMSAELAHEPGAGIAVPAMTASDLAAAVITLQSRLDRYKAAAGRFSRGFLARHDQDKLADLYLGQGVDFSPAVAKRDRPADEITDRLATLDASGDAPATRCFILEPAMHGKSGHAFWLSKAAAEGARARGMEAHVLAHQNLDLATAFDGVRAWFRHTQWDCLSADPLVAWIEDLEDVGRSLAEDLARLSPEIDPERDCIFIGTATPFMIHALGLWLSDPAGPGAVRVMINTGLPTGLSHDGKQVTETGMQYRMAFNTFPAGHRVHLISTTEPEAREFSILSNIQAQAKPWPVMVTPRGDEQRGGDGLFTVLCPGSGHSFQKFDLLDEMVSALSAMSSEPMRLVIQDAVAEEIVQQIGAVEVIRKPRGLPEVSYRRLYLDADCVLLPYDPAAFRTTVSGQFAYGAALGVPMIVPSMTIMADELRFEPAAGIEVQSLEPSVLAAAVAAMRKGFPLHKAAAEKFAQGFNKRHGMVQFLDAVFAVIGR